MKRTLLLPLMLLTTCILWSQQAPPAKSNAWRKVPRMVNVSPDASQHGHSADVPSSLGYRALEEIIGHTTFDVQSYAAMGRRIADLGDGKLSAIYHFGADQAGGYPDRGAAYTTYDGSAWGPEPTSSIETTRSGFPSFTVTPNGTEVIASHKSTSGTQWTITVHTKAQGETGWTEHAIPSQVPGGPVWAKVAAGGPDGNTLHVVAVTVHSDYGGAEYAGMLLHPLYWRSTDGGSTWDKQDVIIPGWDSTFYNGVGAENYAIEARGNTVVIASLESWGDVAIYKSTDNGENWERTIVHDFPLDAYDDSGYTADDIPDYPNAPTDLAILTTDGSGSIVIDQDNKAHLFFSWLFVENTSVYLDMNGIAYWNEDYVTDEIYTIAVAEDYDEDGSVAIGGDIGTYRYGNGTLATFANAGIDEDGNLYVVYSALREDFVSVDDENYRHLFIIKSEDGGETWSAPFDLINEETTSDLEFIEAAFPAIPMNIGDAIHLTYMQDFVPGLYATGETVNPQNIVYLKLDKNTFGMVSHAGEKGQIVSNVVLSPNPTNGISNIQYEMPNAGEVNVAVFSAMGEQVFSSKEVAKSAGEHSFSIDLKDRPAGVYFVKMEVDGKFTTKKLLKN